MHFVGLALEPFEKSADAVPTIVLVILFAVFARALLALDHEILVAFRQFLEWKMDVDLLPGAGAEQVLLRFAHFFAAENAHRALRDGERPIGDRAVEIDRDGAAEAAALRAGAERIVETEKSRRRRPDIEIAMRAMPAGGEGMFVNR